MDKGKEIINESFCKHPDSGEEKILKEKRYVDLNEILLALPKSAEKMVRDWPAEDVRPVIHSRWILNKDGSGTCKNCGHVQYYCWDLDNWDNFCHFCGADMKEK